MRRQHAVVSFRSMGILAMLLLVVHAQGCTPTGPIAKPTNAGPSPLPAANNDEAIRPDADTLPSNASLPKSLTCHLVDSADPEVHIGNDAMAAAFNEAAGLLNVSMEGVHVERPLRCTDLLAIETLDLGHVASLEDIQFAADLRSLSIKSVGDGDLSPLSELAELQTLAIGPAVWEDAQAGVLDLGPLASCTKLEALTVRQAGLDDLGALRDLQPLRTLILSHNAIDDLTPLAALSSLETLMLDWNPVADVSPLAALPALNKLVLANTDVVDIAPLTTLPALAELDVTSSAVADLAPLLDMPKLETVWSCGTPAVLESAAYVSSKGVMATLWNRGVSGPFGASCAY